MRLWTSWNEPNFPQFLLPQWERVGGVNVPVAPMLYKVEDNRLYLIDE